MKIEQLKHPSIDAQLSTQVKHAQELHYKMLHIQLSSLRFLLQQGLAIRGHEEMEGNLILTIASSVWGMLRLKTAIENTSQVILTMKSKKIMSNYVLRQVLHDIREATMYSLIADEATDVCNKEQLCISHFDIHEDPVELINVPKTDSATLTTVIKDCLIRLALPLSQCHGQAYDGASNMSGHVSGVAARILHSGDRVENYCAVRAPPHARISFSDLESENDVGLPFAQHKDS